MQDAANALPPCAQTPAIDPPCTGLVAATATAMSAQVETAGQLVVAAQLQISDDQAWLEAFVEKLANDEAVNRGLVDADRPSRPGRSPAGTGRVTQ